MKYYYSMIVVLVDGWSTVSQACVKSFEFIVQCCSTTSSRTSVKEGSPGYGITIHTHPIGTTCVVWVVFIAGPVCGCTFDWI